MGLEHFSIGQHWSRWLRLWFLPVLIWALSITFILVSQLPIIPLWLMGGKLLLLESWHSFWKRQAHIFRSPDYLQNKDQTFHSGSLHYFPPSTLHSGNLGQKRNWWFREQDAVFLRLKFLYFWSTRNRQESVGFLSSDGIKQRANIKNTQASLPGDCGILCHLLF